MSSPTLKERPAMDSPTALEAKLAGVVGDRLQAGIEEWLLMAPVANPSLLQMFRDRDRLPRRKLVPWAGEFIGKHLTAAALTCSVLPEKWLRYDLRDLTRDLAALQDRDGYLGPHPRSERLTGRTVDGHALWDVWGHYHCIVGLLLWAPRSGGDEALATARRIGDLICRAFLDAGVPLSVAGAEEMNMAIAHGMCLLYRATGERRYLEMALRAVKDWEIPPAGDYLRAALAGKEFFACPKPRWESLHDLLALPELYYITGEEPYRRAFEHYWWSIFRGDRHNTGGFSSGEQATGNPYDTGAIETCCTVAWIVMSVEMLRLTGDPRVADEIELATLTASLGGQHPSGRWWTYNTPMDGVKLASAHEIVFQSHPGGPELNCCSVNAPRGPAMIAEWGLMRVPDGVALNYYGAGSMEISLPSGHPIRLVQRTSYPRSGSVRIRVGLRSPETFSLRLRIPQWSTRTRVALNREPLSGADPGAYMEIAREWRDGDTIQLSLDMRPHFWVGEREQAGKVSVYRGPLLLAYDQRFNTFDPEDLPPLDVTRLKMQSVPCREWPEPWVLLAIPTVEGDLVLCDFATAGALGTHYRSWLPATDLTPPALGREDAPWIWRPSEPTARARENQR
jgi:DUF1680 family protein